MADIRNWQEAEGKTDAEMAALLSDRLGRTISLQGYRIGRNRRTPPPEWLHALNIAPQEPAGFSTSREESQGVSPAGDEGGGVRAPQTLPLPFDPAPVRQQIEMVYALAGKGAALAIRRRAPSGDLTASHRAAMVENTWAVHAPQIAEAYIEWAKEDPAVARVLNAMTLGGPKGKLVMLHGSLIVSTLIASGAVNPERLVPPSYRAPEETDRLADDGSPVVDLTAERGENGDTGTDTDAADDAVPPQGTRRRTRARANA